MKRRRALKDVHAHLLVQSGLGQFSLSLVLCIPLPQKIHLGQHTLSVLIAIIFKFLPAELSNSVKPQSQ